MTTPGRGVRTVVAAMLALQLAGASITASAPAAGAGAAVAAASAPTAALSVGVPASSPAAKAAPAASGGWPVFQPASRDLPMGDELLANGGFEAGAPSAAEGWSPHASGYEIEASGGRGGGRALRLSSESEGAAHGAVQSVRLDQTDARPLYFSGWSRAEGVTGQVNADYSVYLDLRYDDGTPLYGQTLRFDVGTHGWQRREAFIVPAKPVAALSYYCLFRNAHVGTAWFDDLTLRTVDASLVNFDGSQVAVAPSQPPPFGGDTLWLRTSDGLAVGLSARGGAVTNVRLGPTAVGDAAHAFAGGLFVRDVAAGSEYEHVGGEVQVAPAGTSGHAGTRASGRQAHEARERAPDGRPADDPSKYVQHSRLDLGLDVDASYEALPDRIRIRATLGSTPPMTRAVTLYFALPVTAAGWTWGDDPRVSRDIAGVSEFAALGYDLGVGAIGRASKYPWAGIAGPAGGVAVGVPLDEPRTLRLAHNPLTGQLYAAFDLGLSPFAGEPRGSAGAELVLYPFDAEWGFRAASQGYYDRFPEFFRRRVPPEREGIWVAFSDLSPIPEIADFGIAFHELGSLGQVPFDDAHDILSFRYIAEPWSHWLPIDDPAIDPADYDQTVRYLRAESARGNRRAQATLVSGFWDEHGRYRYESTVAPWCRGRAGCAVFTLNPDPDVAEPGYDLNKATLEWNDDARAAYETLPGLDGEYIDSYLSRPGVLDFRTSHFAASDLPLTYRTSDRRVGVPEVQATTEFARWLTDEVHGRLGRPTMANGALLDMPWGADLFDFMGKETDWLRSGAFAVEPDSRLLYHRALSYQRPYGLLMNTNFDNLSRDLVERYFQACLFYGIYPSMFSHNAAEDTYWDDASLYERDRPLFRRYVPMIRELNRGGWRPITHATTSSPGVIVERFGTWPDLLFTLRNVDGAATATATLAIDSGALGLPSTTLAGRALVSGAEVPLAAVGDAHHALTLALGPGSTEVLLVAGRAIYLPFASR